jgi:hypothetical protein
MLSLICAVYVIRKCSPNYVRLLSFIFRENEETIEIWVHGNAWVIFLNENCTQFTQTALNITKTRILNIMIL